ncbi:MAG: DUF763 domain-containing protein [candidate division WOR-3 bacterium]
MRTGFAELPLHWGNAPRWLFERMKKLSRAICEIIIGEYGTDEFLRRISDPVWFQSFGCVLGFDWHSSGLTTTLCGALKEGLKDLSWDFGLFIAGGKGKTSRKTPDEIRTYAEKFSFDPNHFIFASKMSAKIDTCALQDGYQIYHHTFIGTKDGKWAVVQQGMNVNSGWARRYHWLSLELKDFVNEPHKAIVCNHKGNVLNMVANESESARKVTTLIASEAPEKTIREFAKIKTLNLAQHHPVLVSDINPKYLKKILLQTYEKQPENFLQLLDTQGLGPKTIRALTLISDVIYGAKPSFTDPVSYSFAHGGKDGHPYPINQQNYDQSIMILEKAIKEAKIGQTEKLNALKRLSINVL